MHRCVRVLIMKEKDRSSFYSYYFYIYHKKEYFTSFKQKSKN